MSFAITAAEIAAIVQPVRSLGATREAIRCLAPLDEAGPGELAFLASARFREQVARSRASVLLLPTDFAGEPPPDQQWLLVDNPSLALTRICRRLETLLWPRPAPGVHPSAVVAPDATLGAGATVGPLCVVEAGAAIGEGCILEAGVSVGPGASLGRECWLGAHVVVARGCVLGARVRIQPGAVIGADGYGYETVAGRHEKIPQIGIVSLGDDVEVGANCTIDRARFSRTMIGEGTKIDNLVHIAHNCTIGRHCLLVAQVGIAGSTKIGDYVVIAGQAGLAGHLTIGSFAKIGGGSAVSRDIPAKAYVNGQHALPFLLEQKFQVLRPRLPELFRRVDRIERQLGLPAIAKKPSA